MLLCRTGFPHCLGVMPTLFFLVVLCCGLGVFRSGVPVAGILCLPHNWMLGKDNSFSNFISPQTERNWAPGWHIPQVSFLRKVMEPMRFKMRFLDSELMLQQIEIFRDGVDVLCKWDRWDHFGGRQRTVLYRIVDPLRYPPSKPRTLGICSLLWQRNFDNRIT